MNDEYRTIQNNMNTITKEEQELIASCERVGGDSRELARLSRRLIAGIDNMGTLNGDLCDTNFDLGKDLFELKVINLELVESIEALIGFEDMDRGCFSSSYLGALTRCRAVIVKAKGEV